MNFTDPQEVYAKVVQKAWEDATFKASLVADPIATLEAFTGEKVSIPEGKTLVVRDQTDQSTVYVNIPGELNLDNVELTDEQLELVAGGITPSSFIIIAIGAFSLGRYDRDH